MCSASTWPFVCGRPAWVWVMRGAEPFDRLVEALAAVLVAVVGEHALEPPACPLELRGDAAGELGGLGAGWVALLADDELGPGIASRAC